MAEGHLAGAGGVVTDSVSFEGNGLAVDGYLARPADGQPHPGVVLIQEWWGLEPHITQLSERLAGEGFIVLAPDLYHGKIVTEPDDAQKEYMALNMREAVAEIRAALGYLRSRGDVQPKQVGVTGFCMGGVLAWKTAELEDGELGAVAPFYAAGYSPTADDIAQVTAPVLAVWGAQDGSVAPEQRDAIVALLRQQGKTYSAHVYDAGHAFMNDTHDTYDAASARNAYAELVAWLKRYLG